jgi:isoleucyl-tRNA synthetase
MYEVLIAVTKLVSPILTHTADEVWEQIPSVKEETVQLTDMPEVKVFGDVEELKATWNKFMSIRDDVLKALEQARNEKIIGKSLTAAVTLYASGDVRQLLTSIDQLEKLFIVSNVTLAGEESEAPEKAARFEQLAIEVEKAEGETCERCWVVSPTVGQDTEHPNLCTSCAETVKNYY